MRSWLERRGGILWSLAILALVIVTWGRIWLVHNLRDQGWFAKYIVFADRILAGDMPVDRIGDVSPAYLWLMVVIRWMGLNVAAIRDVQIVALSVGIVLCALAARRLGGGLAAIGTAVLILGNRAALITASEIEPETLIFVLNAAAILVIIAAARAPRDSRQAIVLWIIGGLLIGASTVARPVAILALLLAAVWALTISQRAVVALLVPAMVPVLIVLSVNGAITGHVFIMQPGGQFYESNSPLSTGCAGVLPRIVADLDRDAREPDYLHVAYRLVAQRAAGAPIDAAAANRYWSGKAFAFIREYPGAELRLLAWKALLSIHHYDVYDLVSTKRKSLELARYPAIPFGVSFVLTIAGLALSERRRELLPVLIFAFATFVALVAFNVSSRQRNALLVPLSILGGVGISRIAALLRPRTERALLAFGGVMILTPLLGIEGRPMQEDDYNWSAALQADGLRAAAFRARERGDRLAAARDATAASLLATSEEPLVSGRLLREFALDVAQETDSPERKFDAAIALQKAGAWPESEAVLATLERYRPLRENRAVSSVAFYRARAVLAQRGMSDEVRRLLDMAIREAPGDPAVLALRAVAGDPSSRRILQELHDPFTADFFLAGAYADAGDLTRADALLASLERRIPEWRRPSAVRHALRTSDPRSGSSEARR